MGEEAYIVHPWTGDTSRVSKEEAAKRIASQGMEYASPEQIWRQLQKEKFGGIAGQAAAGVAGLARGATLGLSDIALTKIADVPAADLRALQEYNPQTSSATNLLGAVGGSFVPAAPIARLTGLGARAAERVGVGAITKGIAREATIGAGIGAGQGISDVALHDEMGVGQSLAHVAKSAAVGAGIGAAFATGFGITAFGAGAVTKAVRKRYDATLVASAEMRAEHKVLDATLKSLKAELPVAPAAEAATIAEKIASVEARFQTVGSELGAVDTRVVGKIFMRAAGAGLAVGLEMVPQWAGGGITGGILGTMLGPTVIGPVKDAILKNLMRTSRGIRSKMAGGIQAVGERVTGIGERVGRAGEIWGKVRAIPGVGDVAESLAQKGLERVQEAAAGVAVKFVKEKLLPRVGRYIAESADKSFGAANLGGFAVGGLPGQAVTVASYIGRRTVVPLGDMVVAKVLPKTMIARTEIMTPKMLRQITEEIPHIDVSGVRTMIAAERPKDIPAPIVDAMSGSVLGAVSYLQEVHPRQADPVTGETRQVPRAEQDRYERVVAAVVEPKTMIDDFLASRLTRPQVTAWERVYPEALGQLRDLIGTQKKLVESVGGRYTSRQAAQIAMILGEKSPRMYDAQRVRQIQDLHRAERANEPARARPVSGISEATKTKLQGLQERT